MNIGEFKSINGQLRGSIATATIDLPRLGLRPVVSKNAKAPRFEIVSLNPGKNWVQVGALWEATAKGTGEVFYQGQLDDPSLAAAVPVALFGNEDEGYRVAWTRPQPQNRSDSLDNGSTRRRAAPTGDFGEGNADDKGQLESAGVDDDDIMF